MSNKRNAISALAAIAVLMGSANAFASLARQAVLGTADPFGVAPHGSFFYDDNLNVIYNPSYAADFKNWATVQKNSAAGNNAEGGFVANMEMVSLGVYLNRSDAITGTYVPPTGTAAINPVRPLDVFVAGDAGMKWGLGLTYGSNDQTATNVTATTGTTDLTIRAGLQVAGFEPYARFKIIGKQKDADVDTAKTSGYTVGLRYKMGEWIPFAAYNSDTNTTITGGTETKAKTTTWGLGLGRNMNVAEGTRLVYAVSYWHQGLQVILPINVGVESDVTSWMALRGGLQYNFVDQNAGRSVATATNPNTQSAGAYARFGAAFKLGKVEFDWAVGNGGVGATGYDSPNYDLTNGFFSTAALTYNW